MTTQLPVHRHAIVTTQLTDGALADRLTTLSANIRAFTPNFRAALLLEAARRLDTTQLTTHFHGDGCTVSERGSAAEVDWFNDLHPAPERILVQDEFTNLPN